MAFKLQVSNSLDQLSMQLCDDMKSNQQEVFQPIYIVTQTDGMNTWLKLQIANKIGIAANCIFLKPNDLINKIYYLLDGKATQTLTAENMNWLLFMLLADEEFKQNFPIIASYYNNKEADDEVKRMALAEKIADLFDQYQIYRPDMIQAWNDDLVCKNEEERWQRALWQSAKKLTNKIPDKSTIGKDIEQALQKPELRGRLLKKMPVIYLFGISVITEYHLNIFQQIAGTININYLFLNPAPSIYWFDDKSEKLLSFLKRIGRVNVDEVSTGNPLLLGWGKIIQDTFSLLFKSEELINAYEDLETIPQAGNTLLQNIQLSIYENEPIKRESLFSPQLISDGSITINSCYSPAREVEALYNYLVHLVDKRKAKLSHGDIVVMVSDIDHYASYIKAIFNNAPYKFRYAIADESYASSDSISNALHAVLSITADNFTAEEVVRLLDSSFIRNRFHITDAALIRNVVNEANIRFGIEGNKEDDSVYISWQYGLQRIMYGICISGGLEFNVGEEDSFYPLDITEGSNAHEVIRFVHFAQQLIASLKEREHNKTIGEWVKYVEQILHNFICKNEETIEEDYLQLIKQLGNYNAISHLFTEKISYEVFMHNFLANVTSATKKNSFAIGGITFCSLIPMRSIPFKVVALLGLNFDKFPRRDNALGFNLMEKNRKKGDRNVKENDKHLFLETLLSAQDYLYISYIGQSVKDNSSIPPSTLVDELTDYIISSAEAPKDVRAQLITLQPLHSFSKQYDGTNSKLYSYFKSTKSTTKLIDTAKVNVPVSFTEISINSLVSFLKNPFKGYYNKVLGIYYRDEENILSDTELFELDSLQKWPFKNQLLNIDGDKEMADFKNKQVKTGGLPLKNMADVALQDVEVTVAPVRILFKELTGIEKQQSVFVDIKVGKYKLTGSIDNIYGNKLIAVSWSGRENKYLLEAYIHYLALIAEGKEIKLHFISSNKEHVFDASQITKTEAIAKLENLLEIYEQGHNKIIPFDPYFNIKPNQFEVLNDEEFKAVFDRAVNDRFNNYVVPCNDAYLNIEYEHGFFKTTSVAAECRLAGAYLLAPLAQLFPEYYL